MVKRRAEVWCRVLQKRVCVILVEREDALEEAGMPQGWCLRRCLDKGFDCVGKECPFSVPAPSRSGTASGGEKLNQSLVLTLR